MEKNIQNFRDSNSEYSDYSYFVYGLIKQYQPRQVFEVGLGPHGHTSFAILSAMKENNINNSKYYVLDYNPTEEAQKMLNNFSQDSYDLIVGDSANPKLFEKVQGEIDVFLVDGNHTTQYCYQDTINLLLNNRFNTESGIIVYHDTKMMTVKLAIEKLKKDFNLDVFFIPNVSIALAKVKY
jgi:predicted O-methyltransferase YrrM